MIIKYLWYRLYRAALKSGLKETPFFLASLTFSLLIHLNVFELSSLLAKLDILPFMYRTTGQAKVMSIILAVLSYIYFRGDRAKAIIDRFSQETDKQRKRGYFLFIAYIILLVVAFYVLAFFKPGYLPKW